MSTAHQQLLAHLEALERKYVELERQLVDGAAQPDASAYQHASKELMRLRDYVLGYRTYRRLERDVAEAEQMVHAQGETELREMAREEVVLLRQQQARLLDELERQWQEESAEPDRPIILEIRAATGGLESSLFVGDLYRMYTKFAARCGLQVELMESAPTEAGGFRDLSFSIKGAGAFQRFKYESGVHRVQRVPATEAQGRIHTSTVTVAVMPEPEEVELAAIPAKDLQIDVFRSSGPGGQSVNTTDSAVRIRHLPSGIMVTCQDERSQLRNKEKAMRVLRARLLDQMQQTQQSQIASNRRQQVGTGERSEKIRTYNYPDRRVTDHRIGLTLHKFDQILEGNLQELVDALAAAERSKQLGHESAA
jgi:peptide chain release factor 1